MPISIKTREGVTARTQSDTATHDEERVVIALFEGELHLGRRDLRGYIQADLTPDEAEEFAAKMFHSARVARYMAYCMEKGPKSKRPSTGPKGMKRLLEGFEAALRKVVP